MGNVLMNSTVPLFFETACEVTYPVAEGVTNLVLTLANNIAGLVFLLIQMIPHIGNTAKFKIRKIAVIILKFEQSGFTLE